LLATFDDLKQSPCGGGDMADKQNNLTRRKVIVGAGASISIRFPAPA